MAAGAAGEGAADGATARPLPGQGSGRKPAFVVSHERSGTHFLMNTLERNFGYLPWTDVDELLGVPVRDTAAMLRFLFASPWPWQTVLKCHYAPELLPFLPALVRRFDVLHVVREPLPTLQSFYRYVRSRGPEEGPANGSAAEFVGARPRGRMLRYQAWDVATVAARWAAHTASWLGANRALGGAITLVRYDELDERFAESVARLAVRLGFTVDEPVRPDRLRKVVHDPLAAALPADLDAAGLAVLERDTAAVWASVPSALPPERHAGQNEKG